jgi:hypothetical protein
LPPDAARQYEVVGPTPELYKIEKPVYEDTARFMHDARSSK